ncbi:trigger factor-like [Bactrocera neohumeralis]|uniref:trigger factor-like n=1 Tax=Bactrocera neohumeralis TaxID=98809 RepID=UPI0021652AA8|nr:trigger factor-like [Bactrocera neohumeralis]
MEELSKSQFLRLSEAQKEEYIRKLDEDVDAAIDSEDPSDSEDDDWFPDGIEASDTEDYEQDGAAEIEEDTSDREAPEGEEEEDDDDDKEEGDDNEVAVSTSNSRSDSSSVPPNTSTTFIAKDKIVWNKTARPNHQIPARNIVRQRAGPQRSTEMLSIAQTLKKISRWKWSILLFAARIKKQKPCIEFTSNNIQKMNLVYGKK